MNKRGFLLFIMLFLSAIIISACGSSDEEDEKVDAAEEKEEVVKEEKVEEPEEEVEEVEEEPEEEESEEVSAETGDFAELIAFMEEESEGTANVVFENANPQSHDMEGLSVTLDAYTLVELTDFHTNISIPFDDQTDGAVIITQYTVKNDTDGDVHYMPTLDMTYVGSEKYVTGHRYLLPEDKQLPNLLSHNNDYLVEAGKEVKGYFAYALGEDRYATVLDLGSVDILVPTPQTDMEDFSSTFGSDGRFTISLDADSAEKADAQSSQGFYADKVTRDNMGEKEMLEEKEDIGASEELGDATVTLDGYQFTNFIPNADEAPRFHADEVVLLTVKFMIDNGHDVDISKSSISSTLHVNDGQQYLLNEGMLLLYKNTDIIAAGESGELLQVFLLDQEQYEKIWKEKSFEMEIGPMRDLDAQDISKGHRAEFKLK